jgi:5-methyltetrahydrofolate--homocysteine methyltransferase
MAECKTILRSRTRELAIFPSGPVVPIGERCNALGYKNVRQALQRGDYKIFERRAAAQEAAGAQILNVNVVCEGVSEVEALPKVIQAMTSSSSCPLSIDFSNIAALEAALKSYSGRPLINSVNGELAKMKQIFPLMKQYDAAAVALLVDDSAGIPMDPEMRVKIAERIIDAAAGYGLSVSDFIFDCVVLGSATEPQSANVMFETMRRLRARYNCNITLGASNAAFGLPERELFNAHFLSASMAAGCNVPITDPTIPELRRALMIGDILRGADEYAMGYISEFRKANQPVEQKVGAE